MHVILLMILVADPSQPSGLDARLAELFKPAGLTADDAAKAAAASSNDVKAKVAALDAAQGNVDSAGFAYIPRLTTGAGYTRVSEITPPPFGQGDEGRFVVVQGPAGPVGSRPLFAAPDFSFPVFLDNGLLRAGLAVPLSDYVFRTAQQLSAARHSRDSASWEHHAATLKAAADARLAYYQWVRALGQRVVADAALEQAKAREGDIQHAFDEGAASKADLLRFKALVESARLLAARAENASFMAQETLSLAMHAPPGRQLEVGEDISRELSPVAKAAEFEPLVSEAVEKRVELKGAAESVVALEAQRRGLWANVAPRLDLSANLLYANPNPRYIPGEQVWHLTWDVGAVVSWAPTDIPGALAQIGAADARVRQVDAQRQALLDALRLEVRQAFLSLRESEVALTSTWTGLQAAEESYRVRQDLFRNGRATVVEVIDAETELTRARLEALNARIDARIARVRLEHATGRDAHE